MSEKIFSDDMIKEFYNFTTTRHLVTKLPKEAFFYFPSDKEIIEYDNKNLNKLQRKIFEGRLEYICFEKAKLEELEIEIESYINNKKNANKKLILPREWREYNSLRFLQATSFDVKKTIEIIISHLEWRSEFLPPKINEKVMEILNIGYLYIHGRDHRFRPIIHINASVINKYTKKYNFDDWNLATIYFMEYTIKNLLLPGQIENWVIICDLKDVSVMSLPSDFKKILGILQNNYRCRLFRMFIVNVGSFFNMMWGVIKKIIDANTEKKIKILKAGNSYEIFEIINPTQIEKKYCGQADNINNYFFPPIFPSDKYLTEFEDGKNLFVNEEEYKNRVLFNSELTVSPYVKMVTPPTLRSSRNKNDIDNANEQDEKEKRIMENLMKDESKIEKENQFQNDESMVNEFKTDFIEFKRKTHEKKIGNNNERDSNENNNNSLEVIQEIISENQGIINIIIYKS